MTSVSCWCCGSILVSMWIGCGRFKPFYVVFTLPNSDSYADSYEIGFNNNVWKWCYSRPTPIPMLISILMQMGYSQCGTNISTDKVVFSAKLIAIVTFQSEWYHRNRSYQCSLSAYYQNRNRNRHSNRIRANVNAPVIVITNTLVTEFAEFSENIQGKLNCYKLISHTNIYFFINGHFNC